MTAGGPCTGSEVDPPVPTAVAASSAIPGVFAPVPVAGVEYIDGGLHSPTNADLLADEGLDVVIIVSPMSGGSGPLDAAVRSFARRRLRAESELLRAAGCEVLCFEPNRPVSRAMGFNPMTSERSPTVVSTSFFETAAALRRSDAASLLGPAGSRRHGQLSAA